MTNLIEQIREAIPFDTPISHMCNGPCTGCSKKLLDYLDIELLDHERALKNKVKPKLGDIDKLAHTSKKIYLALKKNGLVE